MATTNMNELNRMVGQLIAGIEGIKEDVTAIRFEMRESEKTSAESRKGMHRRLDEVVGRTGTLEREMHAVQSTVTDVKAVTDKVTMWEQRGIGALAMSGFAASAFTFLITHYWEQIVRYFARG